MYKDTITLFNRYPNRASGTKWQPVVLHEVDVNMDRAALIRAMGTDTADSVRLHVKYHKDRRGKVIIGDKEYLLPKEYIRQPLESLEDYITFKSGKEFDFFYYGEWDNTTLINDDDYTDGFYNYMNSEYDNVFTISSASGTYNLIPHFEILGK